MAAKSTKRTSDLLLNQLSLFDALAPTPASHSAEAALPAPTKQRAQTQAETPRAQPLATTRPKRIVAGRVLTTSDMPHYSDEAIEAADLSLRRLPRDQIWFTYKDVKYFFGVSRATVARRLRERLVPGILIDGDHVVEDAAIRRFDRDQLRWLLLAVRNRPRQISR